MKSGCESGGPLVRRDEHRDVPRTKRPRLLRQAIDDRRRVRRLERPPHAFGNGLRVIVLVLDVEWLSWSERELDRERKHLHRRTPCAVGRAAVGREIVAAEGCFERRCVGAADDDVPLGRR